MKDTVPAKKEKAKQKLPHPAHSQDNHLLLVADPHPVYTFGLAVIIPISDEVTLPMRPKALPLQ